MGVRLRVVLDQLTQVVDADHAAAASELAVGLIATAPVDCAVDAIVPAGALPEIAGLGTVRQLALARRELAASWQLGIAPKATGGLIHSPTLMAPLVRHDRVHNHDQTTVTLWDLRAWETPESLPKAAVTWQRAMLKRAVRHADAVVVPSHAFAERLTQFAALGERVRVIAGAAPQGFAASDDAPVIRDDLALPEAFVALVGDEHSLADGFRAAVAAGVDAVVLDAHEGAEPRLAEVAAAVGLPERRAHIRGPLTRHERAAILGGARAFVAMDALTAWPWRAVEAMTLGTPVIAIDSGVHRDVIAEGGVLAASDELVDAVVDAVNTSSQRLAVLASDRARAFSWASSAERVWALHADL